MKLNGLYYFHSNDEIIFLQFFEGGRAMSIGKNVRFAEYFSTSNWLKVETDKVDYLYGQYWFGEDNRIKIKLEGEYKIDYRGTIKNVNTFDLVYRCRFTNHRKIVTFRRFSEREHLIYPKVQKRF